MQSPLFSYLAFAISLENLAFAKLFYNECLSCVYTFLPTEKGAVLKGIVSTTFSLIRQPLING